MRDKREIGMRVGAVRDADATTVYLYGWGVYEGDHVPTAAEVRDAPDLAHHQQVGVPNPRIRLDGGRGVVWGCQCWWGPEQIVRERIIGARAVEIVDPRSSVDAPPVSGEGQAC
jgi:hypothetical protein